MTLIKGKRMARTPASKQHVADRIEGGQVLALCGNLLFRPATTELTGVNCPDCDRVLIAKGAGA